jgi:Kef-type K+ transport system membrane component KefB
LFRDFPQNHKLAISILSGTIFVARSPSSAIAIINELRARGPFTQTALGVTVLKDVLVIILFTICFSLSQNFVSGREFKFTSLIIIFIELLVSFGLGWSLSKALNGVLYLRSRQIYKTILILLLGYGTYQFTYLVKHVSMELMGFEFYLEPLLICIVGSLLTANSGRNRGEFLKIIEDTGPFIYLIFFTYIGSTLSVDTLEKVWFAAFIFFAIRMIGLVMGSYTGGFLANDPVEFRRLGWMPYVTQAGVAIGLTARIAVEFSQWGDQLATILIAVIVINQIVGPPFFKYALEKIGEGKAPADALEFDGVKDVIIFGLESQSIALAKQLKENGWQVIIATKKKEIDEETTNGLDVRAIDQISKEEFEKLDIEHADALVCMLTDYENQKICELAYREIGIKDLVVRL